MKKFLNIPIQNNNSIFNIPRSEEFSSKLSSILFQRSYLFSSPQCYPCYFIQAYSHLYRIAFQNLSKQFWLVKYTIHVDPFSSIFAIEKGTSRVLLRTKNRRISHFDPAKLFYLTEWCKTSIAVCFRTEPQGEEFITDSRMKLFIYAFWWRCYPHAPWTRVFSPYFFYLVLSKPPFSSCKKTQSFKIRFSH